MQRTGAQPPRPRCRGRAAGRCCPRRRRDRSPRDAQRVRLEPGQINLEPGQSGRLLPRHGQHRRVKVHPDTVVPEFREPDHDASGTAPGVQHPRSDGHESRAEPRLAVHVLTATGQGREACVVVLSGRFPGQLRPTAHGANYKGPHDCTMKGLESQHSRSSGFATPAFPGSRPPREHGLPGRSAWTFRRRHCGARSPHLRLLPFTHGRAAAAPIERSTPLDRARARRNPVGTAPGTFSKAASACRRRQLTPLFTPIPGEICESTETGA